MVGGKLDGEVIVLDGTLVLLQVRISIAPVAVGEGIVGVKLNGPVIVLDGTLVLLQVQVSEPPAVVDNSVTGIKFNSQIQKGYALCILFLLVQCIGDIPRRPRSSFFQLNLLSQFRQSLLVPHQGLRIVFPQIGFSQSPPESRLQFFPVVWQRWQKGRAALVCQTTGKN